MLKFIFFIAISLSICTCKTYVSITFDDGWADNLEAAQMMQSFGVMGTFYINSGRVGAGPQRMTLAELNQIYAMGHEIGGHTGLHQKLTNFNPTQQKQIICGDRQQLLDWGFNTTSFAYPYGANTPDSMRILSECGYNSARDSGGIRTNDSCANCPGGDYVPPQNPLQMRSVSYRAVMGVPGLKWYVQQAQAEESFNAWLIFIFHEFGNYDPLVKISRITPNEFTEFLNWIQFEENVDLVRISDNIETNVVQPIFDLTQPPPETGTPYIVLTFDDGTPDHMAVADTLEQFGMRGVFYINSANIGQPGFLTIENLQNLQQRGHEIGGHSKTGAKLWQLTAQQQQDEICNDKIQLESWGLSISSFAWPYGGNNAVLETIAQGCGYGWARDVGGLLTPQSCSLCPSSVALPFGSNSMKLRSFIVKSYHTLGNIIWQIWRAEERGGTSEDPRVLILIFEKICNGCAFSPGELTKLLTWIKPRFARRTITT